MLEELLYLPNISVTILREGIEHTYESLDRVVSDSLSPHEIRTFEIRFNSVGGRGRITADSTQADEHLMFVDGYDEWCEYVQSEICEFMNKRKRILRSKLSNRYVITTFSTISTILVGQMFTTLSPFGIFYPYDHIVPRIMAYLFIFSTIFFASTFRQYFFPYALWKTGRKKSYDIYTKSIAKIILLSIGLVLSVVLINYIFGGSIEF